MTNTPYTFNDRIFLANLCGAGQVPIWLQGTDHKINDDYNSHVVPTLCQHKRY